MARIIAFIFTSLSYMHAKCLRDASNTNLYLKNIDIFLMPIPDFQTIMLPLLRYLGDEKEHSFREVVEHISELFNLNEEEKRKLLPSVRQTVIYNRIGWAKTYLKKAMLLEYTRIGHFRITDRGL